MKRKQLVCIILKASRQKIKRFSKENIDVECFYSKDREELRASHGSSDSVGVAGI